MGVRTPRVRARMAGDEGPHDILLADTRELEEPKGRLIRSLQWFLAYASVLSESMAFGSRIRPRALGAEGG